MNALGTTLPRWIYWLGLAGVLALAAWMRFSGLDAFSLTLDESTLVEAARGVLERGYPSLYVGTMEVKLATYELVPYFIAASMALLGESDFALRLPSALFGILTAGLVFHGAWKWFGVRAAILAGLIYAVSPWAIHWAQNCFHPAQGQFFVLLTVMQAWRLMREDPAPPSAYYIAAGLFACTYLSWEGSGFLLPILLCLALVMKWGQWRWFGHRHLWGAIGLIVLTVVAQGVRRVMLQVDYLMVGSGKSDVSLPQLAFTKTVYAPYYYLDHFFGTESQLVLSVIFAAGLFLALRSWNMRYVYGFSVLAVLFMTNFLGFYNAHYIYFLLPVFIIAVAAAMVALIDTTSPTGGARLVSTRIGHAASVAILLGLVVAYSTSYGLKFHELGSTYANPVRTDVRAGLAGIDYRGLAQQLAQRQRPGDIVVVAAPLALKHYTGYGGDYFLQTITGRKVIFDPGHTLPRYVDKYAGNPVLRTPEEFRNMLAAHERVWIYGAPFWGLEQVVDADLMDDLVKNATPVAETYDAKLYLWTRG